MNDREHKELENLFSDPKYARKAWRAVGAAILNKPAVAPQTIVDKDGNETLNSMIERYSYESLKRDLNTLADPSKTEPTEIEMIMRCQALKARTDTSAAVFVRDTVGAKPVDESKLAATVSNPYESLSDEELELIARSREDKEDTDHADGQD